MDASERIKERIATLEKERTEIWRTLQWPKGENKQRRRKDDEDKAMWQKMSQMTCDINRLTNRLKPTLRELPTTPRTEIKYPSDEPSVTKTQFLAYFGLYTPEAIKERQAQQQSQPRRTCRPKKRKSDLEYVYGKKEEEEFQEEGPKKDFLSYKHKPRGYKVPLDEYLGLTGEKKVEEVPKSNSSNDKRFVIVDDNSSTKNEAPAVLEKQEAPAVIEKQEDKVERKRGRPAKRKRSTPPKPPRSTPPKPSKKKSKKESDENMKENSAAPSAAPSEAPSEAPSATPQALPMRVLGESTRHNVRSERKRTRKINPDYEYDF